MRNGSPVWSKPDLSMTALPTTREEIEAEPVLAGISTGSPEELPVVRGSISAHICAIIKVWTVIDLNRALRGAAPCLLLKGIQRIERSSR